VYVKGLGRLQDSSSHQNKEERVNMCLEKHCLWLRWNITFGNKYL